MYTLATFVQMRVLFEQTRKLRYLRTAHFVLPWTASEDFLLLLLESICQNVKSLIIRVLLTDLKAKIRQFVSRRQLPMFPLH